MAINGINGAGNIAAYTSVVRRAPVSGLPGVTAPEFGVGKMYTKTTQIRSDAEIKSDVAALAKQEAARGVNGFGDAHGNSSREYEALMYEFVTPYSPDRKSIFAKKLSEISDGLKSNSFDPKIDNSTMERMLKTNKELLGGKEQTARGVALERLIKKHDGDLGGNTITGEVKMIVFRERKEQIGSWSSTYGWGYTPTGAEIARRGEIASLYLSVWKDEKGIE